MRQDWLSFSGAATGTGNGSLLIDVPPNTAGVARTSSVSINGTRFTIHQSILPFVSLYPSSLRIVVGASGATSPQDVQIRLSGAGPVSGTVNRIYPPELTATLAQASLPGVMTIAYNKGGSTPAPGTYQITISLTGADQPSVNLPVTLEVQPSGTPPKPPFGSFDTPANNSTNLAGGFAVTGWTLDDIGVDRVEIWRDRAGSEPVAGNGKVYVGIATFVPGARPDVEALYPSLPLNRRAGWGYMLLSNALPNGGNGTYVLEAIAIDTQGNSASLGRKTVSVNNLASKKPFGAIDTPGQGATISGAAYLNSGWALTPKPSTIRLDGSTITMEIDGVSQGALAYSQFRSDVAGLFPGYNNGATAGGSIPIDSTKLANGMHTIHWIVYDDRGNGDGVGSRYFHVSNAGGAAAPEPAPPKTSAMSAFDGDRFEAHPLDRVEFQLPSAGTDADWTGALIVGDEQRPLPVGSTLGARHGRFSWRLAPGFQGAYDIEFTNRTTGATHRISVHVPAETQGEIR